MYFPHFFFFPSISSQTTATASVSQFSGSLFRCIHKLFFLFFSKFYSGTHVLNVIVELIACKKKSRGNFCFLIHPHLWNTHTHIHRLRGGTAAVLAAASCLQGCQLWVVSWSQIVSICLCFLFFLILAYSHLPQLRLQNAEQTLRLKIEA